MTAKSAGTETEKTGRKEMAERGGMAAWPDIEQHVLAIDEFRIEAQRIGSEGCWWRESVKQQLPKEM